MNPKFLFSHPKRSGRRALGTLLLTLPLSGIVCLTSPVQAQPAPVEVQPAPIRIKRTFKPLPADAKAEVGQFYTLLRQEELCLTPLDFALKDADLDEILAKIKAVLPTGTLIEVRQSIPIRLTLDLKGRNVGDVLQATAGLMGGQLWLFSDRLVIAPKSKLSKEEDEAANTMRGGEWLKSTAAGGERWGASHGAHDALLAVGTAVQESLGNIDPATGKVNKNMVAVTMTFGELSPELQNAVQRAADSTRNESRRIDPGRPRFILRSDDTFRMNATQDGGVSIDVFPSLSQGGGGFKGGGIMWNFWPYPSTTSLFKNNPPS